jgi:uncharacterized membrane protein YuzA (DUF378 family)
MISREHSNKIKPSRKAFIRKLLQDNYLVVFVCLLSVLFSISLFKNISYPLLWADESITVMLGKRVLEYGYPKVHDGKNVVYDLRHPNPQLGIDEKTDAFIGGANWGMYYFVAPVIKLAEMSDDLYTRTAIIRIAFALIGLAGLVLFAFLATQFYYTRVSKTVFLLLFAFFELISVPLVLHLREVRYYPLTVFLTALTIFLYTQYRILRKSGYSTYAFFLTGVLFLLFVTFSPGYFILLASFFIFESIPPVKYLADTYLGEIGEPGLVPLTPKERFLVYLRGILPLIISLILASPLIVFFKTFYIAEEMANYHALGFNTSRLNMYITNLVIIWRYLTASDFIYLAVFSRLCLAFSLVRSSGKAISPPDMLKVRFSNLLTIIFSIYFFAIAKIPNFPFTRYFIPLQPMLALIILLDSGVVYNFISHYRSSLMRYCRGALIIVFIGSVFYTTSINAEYIKGHAYELYHQYRGPLDYLIPFIKEKYTNTDTLVIATNYEETSFMYYLNAKVTIGFAGNNMEQDSQTVPDIIIYRKPQITYTPTFPNLFAIQRYERISFPVADSPANNIPELNRMSPVQHKFRTVESEDENEKVELYIRR